MSAWNPCAPDRFHAMNEIMPPIPGPLGFLMGEPYDHDAAGKPRFHAFAQIAGQHYECAEPLTVAAFRALRPADVVP